MKKIADSKNIILTGLVLFSAIIFFMNGCSKSTDYMTTSGTPPSTKGTGPGENQVFIQDMAFNPATITETVGVKTTITWINKDAVAHTVTSDAGLFDSGSIAPNGTFTYMFTEAGNYKYHCSFHPMMTGEVIVLPAPVTTGY